VVLLDLMMPGVDGWQFRREQLGDPRIAHVPVVVMTAGRDLGATPIAAQAVLFKPLTRNMVVSVVRQLCT
jgi:CheY-like chemotaxis protein